MPEAHISLICSDIYISVMQQQIHKINAKLYCLLIIIFLSYVEMEPDKVPKCKSRPSVKVVLVSPTDFVIHILSHFEVNS